MIAYLKGILTTIQEDSVIVEISGIGYEVICPNPFIFQKNLMEEIKIFTYHHLREDIEQLYGFPTEDDKFLFTKLISVSGIGPKSAIAILANVQVADFIMAIEREDEKYLTQFPGIGKKTARQIILDLKGKLTGHFAIDSEIEQENIENEVQFNEAKEALKVLGYSERELNSVLPQLKVDRDVEAEEIIRKALALLAK